MFLKPNSILSTILAHFSFAEKKKQLATVKGSITINLSKLLCTNEKILLFFFFLVFIVSNLYFVCYSLVHWTIDIIKNFSIFLISHFRSFTESSEQSFCCLSMLQSKFISFSLPTALLEHRLATKALKATVKMGFPSLLQKKTSPCCNCDAFGILWIHFKMRNNLFLTWTNENI